MADATLVHGLAGGGLTGVHHIGIPVRDIERSLQWYREILGLTADFVEIDEGPEASRVVQLENARMRFAFLSAGNTIIELLEYEHPLGRDFDRRNCDVGAIHLCLEVADIAHAHHVLTERGVTFSTEPVEILEGALKGQWCCYFRDPDGIQLELWQRAR
ncbi:MAG TPA: VOC family protein [Solirubrobacteraceae bacterium]|jgi:catechol 2,3-dioxygenase-like lactoylglutathione lyase family enzyme|nr:VOC family protein [Solirubrobacteraceae bacterium]